MLLKKTGVTFINATLKNDNKLIAINCDVYTKTK